MAIIFVMAVKEYKLMGIKNHKTKNNGPLFLLMVLNYVEGENSLKINDFIRSLMGITAELMPINMKNNDLTHKAINS